MCVTKHVSCSRQLNPAPADSLTRHPRVCICMYGRHLHHQHPQPQKTRNNLLAMSINLAPLDPLELAVNLRSERNQAAIHPGTPWKENNGRFQHLLSRMDHPCRRHQRVFTVGKAGHSGGRFCVKGRPSRPYPRMTTCTVGFFHQQFSLKCFFLLLWITRHLFARRVGSRLYLLNSSSGSWHLLILGFLVWIEG